MRTFILSNVPKEASLPYSFRPFWDKTASKCNCARRKDTGPSDFSPYYVAPFFLLPAIIAVLVWSHEQADRVMPCTRWTKVSQHSIHTIPTPVKQQSWLAAICRHSHQHRSPQGAIHILEIPGVSEEHTPFSTPLGATTHSSEMPTSFLRISFSPLRLINELSIIQLYWGWSTGHHFLKCCQRSGVQAASSAHEFHVVLSSSTQ